ncbi:trypsin-like peptidase domain-containing protein [Tamaricihabitans halophyticus]|nr:trypsin-like peptidase domain-containing protein [Tamaricihabitans halophyticus]
MSDKDAGEQEFDGRDAPAERTDQGGLGGPASGSTAEAADASPWSAAGQAARQPAPEGQQPPEPDPAATPPSGIYRIGPQGTGRLPGSSYGPGAAPPPPPGYQMSTGMPGGRPGGSTQLSGRTKLVAGVAALALVVGGAAGALGGQLFGDSGGPSVSSLDTPPPARQASDAPEGSIESVAQKVTPSVAQLQVQGAQGASEGSAFVISTDGYLLTNNHVVEGAKQGGAIQAVFHDGTRASAEVVGTDPNADLAVVKVEGVDNLTPADLGRSDDLNVGQQVVAIGSPYELSGTVTSGIVSSLQRPVRAGGQDGTQATVLDAVQTDAAINPGNSGGPLVNMKGQVIGINSVIYSPGSASQSSAGSVGIGFAIPIDQARRTAEEIIDKGYATQTVLGVSVTDGPNGGALIGDVTGEPASGTDLKSGDVVTKVDNRSIDSADALVAAVRSNAPGDKVTLTVGDSNTIDVTLGGQRVGG